jgi:hypothetical protein
MDQVGLRALLSIFTGQELADALYRAYLPQTGTKDEKITRLIAEEKEPRQLLDLFSAEALRSTCGVVGVQAGAKADMIGRLVVLLESESFAKTVASDAAASVAAPTRPAHLEATKERVIDHLKWLTIPKRKAQDECAAQDAIGYHLGEVFEDVVPQYNVGGVSRPQDRH